MESLPNQPFYSIIEASRILGVSPTTLRRWEDNGRLTPLRTIGGDRRYSPQDIQKVLGSFRKETDLRYEPPAEQPVNPPPNLPPLVPIRQMENYRPSRRGGPLRSLAILFAVLLLSFGFFNALPQLTRTRLERAFLTGPANPIVEVNDVAEYQIKESGEVRLGFKFPVDIEALFVKSLNVAEDAILNTARFFGTLFFGETKNYYITPTGDAAFNSVNTNTGAITSLQVTNLTVTGTSTGTGGTAGGGDADTLGDQSGSYYLDLDNETGTCTNCLTTVEIDESTLSIAASDADTLDGQDGTYYLAWANFTGTPTILSSLDGVSNNEGGIDLIEGANISITPNDLANTITFGVTGGSGSGLDADLLDGQDGAYYLDLDNQIGTCTNCLTTTEIDESTFTGLNSTNIDDIYLFNTGDTGTGTYSFEDDVTLGLTSADTLTVNALIGSDLIPDTDDAYDLGSPTARWQDLYLGPSSLNIYNTIGADAEYFTIGYDGTPTITFSSLADGLGTARNFNFTGGDVGIGTASPASSLEIYQTSPELRLTTSGSSEYARAARVEGSNGLYWYNRVNQPGVDPYALEFDGNDEVQVPDNATIQLVGGDFTARAWVYLNSAASSTSRMIVEKTSSTAPIVSDTFTDTPATALTAHTPDIDTFGGGWKVAFWAGFAISASGTTADLGGYANHGGSEIDAGTSDAIVETDILSGATPANSAGVSFRGSGGGSGSFNRYTFHWVDGGTLIRITRQDTGAILAQDTFSVSPDTTYAFKVILVGTSIKAYVNNNPIFDITDSTFNGTFHGIYQYFGNDTRWDNFKISDSINRDWNFGINNTRKLTFKHEGENSGSYTSTGTVPLSTWTHVQMSVDQTNNLVYFAVGGTVESQAFTSSFEAENKYNGVLRIGKDSGQSPAQEDFDGRVDELELSDTVRNTANFTPSTTRLSPDGNTAALWHLDEGIGTNADDASANGNDGTLSADPNDPAWVTGYVTDPGTTVEAAVWSSENGVAAGESGIQTFGDSSGRLSLQGQTQRFYIGGTEMLRLNASGYLGIGTSTPDSKLHLVGGDAYIAPDSGYSFDNFSTDEDLYVYGSLEVDGTLFTAGQNIAGDLIPAADDQYDLGSSTARWQDLYLGPSSLNIYNTIGADAEYFTIGYDGTPTITFSSLADGLGTARNFNFAGGDVGIGTTSPDVPLEIESTSTNGQAVYITDDDSTNSAAQQLIIRGRTDTNQKLFLGYSTDNDYGSIQAFKVLTGAMPLVLQPNGGSVGIGTTGPDALLDILDANSPQLRLSQADGTVYADFEMDSNGDLIVNVDGVSNQLVLDNGGNVGIGTVSPSAKLHVARDDASTNTQIELARIERTTSGAAAAAWIGSYESTYLETANGSLFEAGRVGFKGHIVNNGADPDELNNNAAAFFVNVERQKHNDMIPVLSAYATGADRLLCMNGIENNNTGLWDCFGMTIGSANAVTFNFDGKSRAQVAYNLLDSPNGLVSILTPDIADELQLKTAGSKPIYADTSNNGMNFLIAPDGRVGMGPSGAEGGTVTFKPLGFATVYSYNGAAYTNNTTEAQSNGGTAFTLLTVEASSNDELYLGMDWPFYTVYSDIATAGAGVTLSAQYWNGAWTALTITDNTSNLTTDGTVTFTSAAAVNWAKTSVNGVTRYWIRLRSPGTNITTAPTAYSVTPSTGDRFAVYPQYGDTIPSLLVRDQGNVGIGTTSPQDKLEVAGSIRITDTSQAVSAWALSRDGANERIGAMAVYNGYLYAGQGNSAGNGDIFYFDGGSWNTSRDGGEEYILSLAVYNGKLYAGQGTGGGDADIFVCNPATAGNAAICDDASDWTTAYDGSATYELVITMAVYNGKLYAGLGQSAGGDGDVIVCNPATAGDATTCDNASDWTTSFDEGGGTTYEEASALAVHDGVLYLGLGNGASDGDIRYCDPANAGDTTTCDNAADWAVSYAGSTERVRTFSVYNGRLYTGLGYSTAGFGDILVCNPEEGATLDPDVCDDTTEWNTSYNGAEEEIPALVVYNGKLYAGQGRSANGDGDVLIFNGAGWAVSYAGGADIIDSLAVYNGKLYAGQGLSATEGDVYTYTEARAATYPVKFSVGTGTSQKVGNLWFENEDEWGTTGGLSDDVGVFKVSHALITTAGLYDVVEDYPTHDSSLSKGEVVSIDPYSAGYVVRAGSESRSQLMGVISSDPGIRLSQESSSGHVPVALLGRVPVRVDPNGPAFSSGDPLTASTRAGTAAKAKTAGMVIGKALENWSPGGKSTVMMLINLSWYDPEDSDVTVDPDGDAAGVNPDGSVTKIASPIVEAEEGIFEKLTATILGTFEKIIAKTAEIASAFIKKLTVESLAVKGESVGQAMIPAGELEISVAYPELTETSKVFFTLDRAVAVGVEKTVGTGFKFILAAPADLPVIIDYWTIE